MYRSNTRDAASRAALGVTRGVWHGGNDDRQMQEADVGLLWGERRTRVERFQNYGFSSVPLAPSNNRHAEVLAVSLGGNRSHMAIIAVDDRRYRVKGLKNGEVAIYDDQGQKIVIGRDGIKVTTPKKVDVEADGDVTVKTKGKANIEAKGKLRGISEDEVILGVKGERYVRIKADIVHLGVKSETEPAPFKVMTEGGLSQCVKARID